MAEIQTANKRRITSAAVLGSTGSVGIQTLDVIEELGLKVEMLTAGENTTLLAEQIRRFRPKIAVVSGEKCAKSLKSKLTGTEVEILYKKDEVLSAVRETSADIIFHSIAGLAGLDYAVAAAESGKRIAMANKEAIIAAGDIIFDSVQKNGGELIPVDSEHSAVYRLLENRDKRDVKRIILTASGGPFLGFSFEEMKNVTPEEALCHPTWKMGRKITIDSATLMNKGFEIIEAVRLFGFSEDKVGVIIHPQSIIHSMIEYNDNTMTAQLGRPDMRDCIRYAVTAPNSAKIEGGELNLSEIAKLTFSEPDNAAFPLMNASRSAIRTGGTAPAALIAADEVAVEEFLRGGIGFTDISSMVIETLEKINVLYNIDVNTIDTSVAEAKKICRQIIDDYVESKF
ncbi:MAG: 1-deoxy-D-xylulose-5-phosphate reductoisomerase [Eubacteriales bacterium]